MAGAPIGNQNAAKGKLITDRIRKACIQEDFKRVDQGIDKLLDAYAAGEPWAVEQILNRFEGKPAQSVELDAEIRTQLVQATTEDEKA